MDWFSQKRPTPPKDDKLAFIEQQLFPQYKLDVNQAGDKYYIDTSCDGCLESAIMDLENGETDQLTIETLRSVAKRLQAVRKVMGILNEIAEEDVKYFVVDTPEHLLPE